MEVVLAIYSLASFILFFLLSLVIAAYLKPTPNSVFFLIITLVVLVMAFIGYVILPGEGSFNDTQYLNQILGASVAAGSGPGLGIILASIFKRQK